MPVSISSHRFKSPNPKDLIRIILSSPPIKTCGKLNDYFRFFCKTEKNCYLWEDIESVFDNPIVLNPQQSRMKPSAQQWHVRLRSQELWGSFLMILKESVTKAAVSKAPVPQPSDASFTNTLNWTVLSRALHKSPHHDGISFKDFLQFIRAYEASHNDDEYDDEPDEGAVEVWPKADIEMLFAYICQLPQSSSYETQPLDQENVIDEFSFNMAMKLHLLSSAKEESLQFISNMLFELSSFAGSKGIALRALTVSKEGKANLEEQAYVTNGELGSVFSTLISDFSLYYTEKEKAKAGLDWLDPLSRSRSQSSDSGDSLPHIETSVNSLNSLANELINTCGTASSASPVSVSQFPPPSPLSFSRSSTNSSASPGSFSQASATPSTSSTSSVASFGSFGRAYRRAQTASYNTSSSRSASSETLQKIRNDHKSYSLAHNKDLLVLPKMCLKAGKSEVYASDYHKQRKEREEKSEEARRTIEAENKQKYLRDQEETLRKKQKASAHIQQSLGKYVHILKNPYYAEKTKSLDDYALLKYNNKNPRDLSYSERQRLLMTAGYKHDAPADLLTQEDGTKREGGSPASRFVSRSQSRLNTEERAGAISGLDLNEALDVKEAEFDYMLSLGFKPNTQQQKRDFQQYIDRFDSAVTGTRSRLFHSK